MDAPTVEQLRTVAGAAILTSVVMFLLLRTLKLSDESQDRFGPVMAIAIGVAITVVASLALGLDGDTGPALLQAVVNGIFAGLSAMGIQNFASKTVLGSGSTT